MRGGGRGYAFVRGDAVKVLLGKKKKTSITVFALEVKRMRSDSGYDMGSQNSARER